MKNRFFYILKVTKDFWQPDPLVRGTDPNKMSRIRNTDYPLLPGECDCPTDDLLGSTPEASVSSAPPRHLPTSFHLQRVRFKRMVSQEG